MNGGRRRWTMMAVFVLATAINYLDRQTLATLAPLLRQEFQLTNAQYGWILSAFSMTYAASAPWAGWLIDRVGLNRAISVAVAVWSGAGIATGFSRSLAGLVGCRAVLGAAEAAGIPAAGKAIHQFLLPAERALGNAVNQAGVSLGLMLAPPVATWLAVGYGWRQAFVITGILGLLWIPLWNHMARGERAAGIPAAGGDIAILRDPRLWAFMAANGLSMTGYSLWTNWTTLYLVEVCRLTLVEAAWFAWVPPLFATLGGLAGGWLSMGWIERGVPVLDARVRACLSASLLAAPSALLPLASTAFWAATGISVAIFAVAAFSVNMYTMPLDAFGGARAAFAVSLLVASYGVVQAVVSPLIGAVVDAYGYPPVCVAAAALPLAGWAVLTWTGAAKSRGESVL